MVEKVLMGGITLGSLVLLYLVFKGQQKTTNAAGTPGAHSPNINVNVTNAGQASSPIPSVANPGAPNQAAAKPQGVITPNPVPVASPIPGLVSKKTADDFNKNIQLTKTGVATIGLIATTAGHATAATTAGAAAAAADPRADAGYLAVKATGEGIKGAGQLVAQGNVNPIQPGFVPGQAGGSFNPLAEKTGAALTHAGSAVVGAAGLGAIGGVIGFDAFSKGFKNATEDQRKKILGQGAVAGAQTALSVVPILGAGLSAALGELAKTHEGQRAAQAAGVALNQGYTAQKNLVNSGDITKITQPFEGGSTHQQRQATFFAGVDQKLGQLAKSNTATLTKADIDSINQARAQGLTYTSSGFDLAKLSKSQDFAAGKNPIYQAPSTLPKWEIFTSGQTALNKGFGQLYKVGDTISVTGPYGALVVKDSQNVYKSVGEALARGYGYLYQKDGKTFVTGPRGEVQINARVLA